MWHTGATDLRKGFDGLYGLVRDRLECDPTSGYAFSSQTRGAIALSWSYMTEVGFGFVRKKLDRGCFRWPAVDSTVKKIVAESRRAGVAVGRYRSESDTASKVVSKACGGRTNRVTENRINTWTFHSYSLTHSLLFKKHREHVL